MTLSKPFPTSWARHKTTASGGRVVAKFLPEEKVLVILNGEPFLGIVRDTVLLGQFKPGSDLLADSPDEVKKILASVYIPARSRTMSIDEDSLVPWNEAMEILYG